jgi:hypothetical protein
VRNVELRTRVCRGYAVVVLRGELDTRDAEDTAVAVAALAGVHASVAAAADSADRRDAGRRAVSIARSGRAVLSGAVYWTMAWRAAVPGSRAGNRSWSPR